MQSEKRSCKSCLHTLNLHAGCSLRSACTSGLADASSGPSPGEAAARSVLTDRPAASIPPKASPQPGGRACFRAARDCSPPPGGGCGLSRFHSEPQIQDSKLNGLETCLGILQFGSQPAEHACSGTNCGPPRPGGCGPPTSGEVESDGQARSRADGPAFEQREIAALRQGAAAGCRSLRDRFC